MKHTAKLLVLVAVASALAQAGCNDPLTVKLPDIIPPSALSDSGALATLRAGAIGDFDLAYTGDHPDGSGGNGEGVILYGGLLADEFVNSETFPTRIQVDSRNITYAAGSTTNSDVDLWYRLMHRARRSAEIAAGRYRAIAPADPAYPEMLTLAGYTYIFFAETYCSGTAVSQIDSAGKITYGQPLTTTQLLDTAIARFDSAIHIATVRDSADTISQKALINFASVGKARALLFQGSGQYAAAAAVAITVPTSFVYQLQHTTTTDRENNGVFNGGATDGRYSISDSVQNPQTRADSATRSQEGINGFPFLRPDSLADPRTPIALDPGGSFDGATPLWDNLRYGSRASPITLATGVEARLIEAEAALGAGQFGTFLTKLNDPRTQPGARAYFNPNPVDLTNPQTAAIPALAPLTAADTVSAGGAVNLLFAERARWLWLTAHRLGDLRRLVRSLASGGYGREDAAVWPTGPYFKGGDYGTDENFPLPVTEQNNPNFRGCLDRNP